MNPIASKQLVVACIMTVLATPSVAYSDPVGVSRSCIVTMDVGDGEWVASRNLTESASEVQASRDSFSFEPKQAIAFQPNAILRWELDYYWPVKATDRKTIEDSDIGVLLYFSFDFSKEQGEPKKPDKTWLHLFRSVNPNERRLAATSLYTDMWWDKFSSGKVSGKAAIPLDHLLAFGQGYDVLAWDIQSAPDRFGATQKLASGMLPISAMRNRKGAMLKLRKLLDKKAAQYKKECHVPITVIQ